MADNSKRPIIIIKKIKKVSGGGHHGGAWKVAYADFVTAMMAFFLLMWLLNASSQVQRRGIANYFGPAGDSVGAGGSGGIMGGTAIEPEGNFEETRASSPISTDTVRNEAQSETTADETVSAQEAAKNQNEKMIDQFETQMFKEAEDKLKKAISEDPDLKALAENILIDQTPEGLRIQIVDKDGRSMFPSASAEMLPETKKILHQVVKIIEKMPNKISISGHTDATPYAPSATYSNWELSSDRANSTRREMNAAGLSKDRIVYVAGKEANEPLLAADPTSERNRRISIVLLRTEKRGSVKRAKEK